MEDLNKIYPVVIDSCFSYESFSREGYLDNLLSYIDSLPNFFSAKVLLKPNLVSGRAPRFGCTDAVFIRTVAICLKNKGAKVVLGDSPAFGSANSVCKTMGIADALLDLDVPIVEFAKKTPVKLDCGIDVNIAQEALDCDFLVNLPKIKAHSQMYMTLAVKNCFGLVVGLQKGMLHMQHGTGYQIFSQLIIDIQKLIPTQLVIGDGVAAMHVTGPIKGEKLDLGLVAVAEDPFAFDTAILTSLKLSPVNSPLWCEAARRNITSTNNEQLLYPLLSPAHFSHIDFQAPNSLIPVRFNPLRFFTGIARRLMNLK